MIYMGEEDEFIKSYDQYADAIFRHCYFRVFDRERARDLTQETFIKTWEYLQDGKEVLNLRAFLYRVATNLIIDDSRKKKEVSLDYLKEKGFDAVMEERDSEDFLDVAAALEAVRQLPDQYREAVTMRYIQDLSPQEIGEILGESENTISVRLHRGIQKLRQIIPHE